MKKTTEERFWVKVRKTSKCWEWLGGGSGGRGYFYWGGKLGLAYHYSWELHKGHIAQGSQINHICDNPSCVRPEHLYMGTQQDNMTDKRVRKRAARGVTHGSKTHPDRLARGERHENSTLSDESIREMRERYAAGGLSQNDLAKKYGLKQSSINSIILGKTRTDAGGPITNKGRVRITENQVACILKKHAMGISQKRIAEDLGISYNAVNEICTGKTHANKGKRRATKGGAKLTSSQTQEIRDRFSRGERQIDLAAEYGVSRSTISTIVLHESW
jgi:transcriptional regulator with XRE-family HTH domain